jgi:hypothetical protein
MAFGVWVFSSRGHREHRGHGEWDAADSRSANFGATKRNERQGGCRSFEEIEFPITKSTTYCRGSQDKSTISFNDLD